MYKTKSQQKVEKFLEIRAEIGDTALLEMIISWWGHEDIVKFMEENSDQLGLDDEEEEK